MAIEKVSEIMAECIASGGLVGFWEWSLRSAGAGYIPALWRLSQVSSLMDGHLMWTKFIGPGGAKGWSGLSGVRAMLHSVRKRAIRGGEMIVFELSFARLQ